MKTTCSLPTVTFALALSLFSTPALATAQRTFVASTGNDASPCSIAQPCRSFAAAIAQTTSGGEVIVLDSAGYGPVTIGKSVSVVAPAGVYAGVSVFSGNGITINGSGIVVALRGLTLNGPGGDHGISFAQGSKLTVEDCEAANFNIGMSVYAPNSKVHLKNVVLRDNASHGFAAGDVLDATLHGVHANGNGLDGVFVYGGARVTVVDSVLADNVNQGVVAAANTEIATDVMVTRSLITGSQVGVVATAGTGGATRVVADASEINNASFAAFELGASGGSNTIYTAGNNTLGFNNGIVSGGSLTPIALY